MSVYQQLTIEKRYLLRFYYDLVLRTKVGPSLGNFLKLQNCYSSWLGFSHHSQDRLHSNSSVVSSPNFRKVRLGLLDPEKLYISTLNRDSKFLRMTFLLPADSKHKTRQILLDRESDE